MSATAFRRGSGTRAELTGAAGGALDRLVGIQDYFSAVPGERS